MNDVLILLDSVGIPYKLYGEHHHVSNADWVQVDCPLCSPDSGRFRLGLNIVRRFANCWKCGGVGFFWILSRLTGLSRRELMSKLDENPRGPSVFSRCRDVRHRKVRVPPGVGELLPIHKKYLRSRGFNPDEIVRLWGVKGIGIAPRLSWSLWIPVFYEGKLVSWTVRRLGNVIPKYHNACKTEESIPAKHLLYGEDYCRLSIVVVEGPTDVWAIGPGAVATMGITVTEEQLYKIVKYPLRIIAFDDEPEAQSRAKALAKRLSIYPGETIVISPDSGKDWAEADKEELTELRKMAGL